MNIYNCLSCLTYTPPTNFTDPDVDCLDLNIDGEIRDVILVPCNLPLATRASLFPAAVTAPTYLTISDTLVTAINTNAVGVISSIEKGFTLTVNDQEEIPYGCNAVYLNDAGGEIMWTTFMKKRMTTAQATAGAVEDTVHQSFFTALKRSPFNQILVRTCNDKVYAVYKNPDYGFDFATRELQPFDIAAKPLKEAAGNCNTKLGWQFKAKTNCGSFALYPMLDINTLDATRKAAWRAAIK